MDKETVFNMLQEEEILTQLAEEASELAQAALKLRRALDGTNHTPKSVRECRKALVEEIADMRVCWQELPLNGAERMATYQIAEKKQARWVKRLQEKDSNGKQETAGVPCWISVKDALPEKDGGHYDGGTWAVDDWAEYPVTHWLPTPELPEEYR